jgi:D-lactate dehydrogenase
MQVAVFSTKSYDREFLTAANQQYDQDLVFYEARLSPQTWRLADGAEAVCAFVNDQLDADVVIPLAEHGVRLIAMRCAGFNNVDLHAAANARVTVARVPAYSPHAVAEHTVGLMLALGRRLYKSYNRVREGNFALEGLLGFDFHGRTVGVVGTGRIGAIVARIMTGFGCRVLAYDVVQNPSLAPLGVDYVPLNDLLADSDVVTLHCPLMPGTYHIINEEALAQMKQGVMLINTSRGALVDTPAAIEALKSGRLGSLAMDVYEEEADLFFEDLSNRVIQDDVFSRMLTFPNVLITGHQAFFTRDAMTAIADYTLNNIKAYTEGRVPPGVLTPEKAHAG